MIHAVFGPRDINGQVAEDVGLIAPQLDTLRADITSMVLGGGRGIELLSQQWATLNGIPFTTVAPNMQSGSIRDAFDARNLEIISQVQRVVLFWDGYSGLHSKIITQSHIKRKDRIIIFPVAR